MPIVMVAAFWLYIIGLFAIPRFPNGPYKLYGDLTAEQREKALLSDNLTNETNHPFDGGREDLDYSTAVQKFPSTESCLVKTERTKTFPDLRFIDWDAFRDLKEVEVCTWRIFSSLRGPQEAKQWLLFHGANGVDLRAIDPASGQGSFTVNFVVGTRLKSNWSDSAKRMPYPSRGIRMFQEGGFRSGNGITAFWDDSGNLRFLYMKWTVLL